MTNEHNQKLLSILSDIDSKRKCEGKYFKNRSVIMPSRKEIIFILKSFQELLFPDYFSLDEHNGKSREQIIEDTFEVLKRQISAAYAFSMTGEVVDTEAIAYSILGSLAGIKEMLLKDIEAIYEGDPAATCPEEVILSYPGFYAIFIYRIAHAFYEKRIPYMARVMTEFAHEKTGIDIHAGAKVGEYFFIDHGTGIVIGETTTIGNHVKIYQGVTLGAKSFELDEDGNPIKGTKRHPDIGDNVVIYANATILGGTTHIGDGAVIGGNVWLTHSVDAGSVIVYGKEKK